MLIKSCGIDSRILLEYRKIMFEIFSHQYFWLSFLPLALLSSGFWLMFFDRSDQKQEPLIQLILALLAGIFSASIFGYLGNKFGLENFWGKIVGEEISKVLLAIVVMEIFQKKFQSTSQGIVYGFAVGIGFAMAENILYLGNIYEMEGDFTETFWLTFQMRFWSSTLLHGLTTGVFGLFYAGAYISKTICKGEKESPLRAFGALPSWSQLGQILTLHVSRKHLLFGKEISLSGHMARAIILEGLLVVIIIHILFNYALVLSYPQYSFLIALVGTWWLSRISHNLK